MAKLTLPPFVGQPGAGQLNTWKEQIEEAIEDTLSRSGELPNDMEADLDMHENDIINIKMLDVSELFVDDVNVGLALSNSEKLVGVNFTDFVLKSEDVGTNPDQLPTNADFRADTIADLAALNTGELSDGQTIIVYGFYEPGDGGGGVLYWDAGVGQSDHNGITIIDANHTAAPGSTDWYEAQNSGSGCFVRQSQAITAKQAGLVAGSKENNVMRVQALVDAADHVVFEDEYFFDADDLPIEIPSRKVLIEGVLGNHIVVEQDSGRGNTAFFEKSEGNAEFEIKNIRFLVTHTGGPYDDVNFVRITEAATVVRAEVRSCYIDLNNTGRGGVSCRGFGETLIIEGNTIRDASDQNLIALFIGGTSDVTVDSLSYVVINNNHLDGCPRVGIHCFPSIDYLEIKGNYLTNTNLSSDFHDGPINIYRPKGIKKAVVSDNHIVIQPETMCAAAYMIGTGAERFIAENNKIEIYSDTFSQSSVRCFEVHDRDVDTEMESSIISGNYVSIGDEVPSLIDFCRTGANRNAGTILLSNNMVTGKTLRRFFGINVGCYKTVHIIGNTVDIESVEEVLIQLRDQVDSQHTVLISGNVFKHLKTDFHLRWHDMKSLQIIGNLIVCRSDAALDFNSAIIHTTTNDQEYGIVMGNMMGVPSGVPGFNVGAGHEDIGNVTYEV